MKARRDLRHGTSKCCKRRLNSAAPISPCSSFAFDNRSLAVALSVLCGVRCDQCSRLRRRHTRRVGGSLFRGRRVTDVTWSLHRESLASRLTVKGLVQSPYCQTGKTGSSGTRARRLQPPMNQLRLSELATSQPQSRHPAKCILRPRMQYLKEAAAANAGHKHPLTSCIPVHKATS
jgi:hypothetical protein